MMDIYVYVYTHARVYIYARLPCKGITDTERERVGEEENQKPTTLFSFFLFSFPFFHDQAHSPALYTNKRLMKQHPATNEQHKRPTGPVLLLYHKPPRSLLVHQHSFQQTQPFLSFVNRRGGLNDLTICTLTIFFKPFGSLHHDRGGNHSGLPRYSKRGFLGRWKQG